MTSITHKEDAQAMKVLAEGDGAIVAAMDLQIAEGRRLGAGRRHLATLTRLRNMLAELADEGPKIAAQVIAYYANPATALAGAGGAEEVYDKKWTATRTT